MSKIDKEQLIQLKREGKTDSECAEVFGCHTESVRQMRRKLEKEGRLTPADSMKAEEYVEEKHLQTDAAPEPKPKTVAQRLAEEEAAEAAKRAEEGIKKLATDDMICPEPVDPTPRTARKFPLGVMPRKMWLEERRDDLRRAICEFACEGMRIDPEWVEEYNELVMRCGG